MKKIIITFTAMCLATLVFISCSRTEDDTKLETSFKNVETIMSDSRLVSYIKNNDDVVNKITNPKRLLELTSKSDLSTIEKNEMAKLMGFSSLAGYINFLEKQNNLLSPVAKEYNLNDKLQLAKFERIVSQNAKSILMKTDCKRSLINCLGVTTSAAIIGHLSCAAADITIIGGVVCHAAIYAAQYFSQDECYNSYNGCNS